MIELELLIRKTVEALNEHGLKNPMDDTIHSIRDIRSIWSSIVFKSLNCYSKSENIRIFFYWKRNAKNYAKRVIEEIQNELFSESIYIRQCFNLTK